MSNSERILLEKNKKIVKEIFWNEVIIKKKNQVCLSDYIEKHSKDLRTKLLSLLEDVESQNKKYIKNLKIYDDFNFWTLTNFREKNLYKKNNFYEITKVLAILEIVDDFSFDEVQIFLNNKYIAKILDQLIKKNKINKLSTTTNNFGFFKHFFYETLNIFRGMTFLISKFFYSNNKYKINSKYNLFFSFFTYLDKTKQKNKIYKSLFWGEISNYTCSNFVHLYLPSQEFSNFNSLNNTIAQFNNSNEFHNFLDSYSSFEMIVNVLKTSLKLKIKYFFNKKKYKLFYKNYNLSYLLILNLRESFYFYNIIKKIYYFYLFEIFFKKNNFESNCFYIHENQPWEKSLIYHWKKNQNKKIYGVVNSSIRFWDLRFAKNNINPDFLLTNGKDSFSKVISFGYNKNKIINVESLRYDKKSFIKINTKQKTNKLLIVFDYLRSSNNHLINILNETKNISKYNIYFKGHPLTKIGDVKCNFEYKFINENNRQDSYDLVICTNKTTAQIDYLMSGYKLAVLLEPNSFNFSPLKGSKDCTFFRSSLDLHIILNKKKVRLNNTNKNNFFLVDKHYKQWNKLLNENKQ